MHRRHRAVFLPILITTCCLAAGPATRPTARPTTRPAASKDDRVRDGLVNGSVRFLVPASWEIVSRKEDGLNVVYRPADSAHVVSMLITQQKEAMPNSPAIRQQMTKLILGWDNDDLKRRKVQVIDPPKVEPDPDVMLRVHERYKDGDDTIDAVHLYRPIGINLVSVLVAAHTDDPAQAKVLHEAGAKLLLSVTLGQPDPRVVRPAPAKKE
jgi:hypothetical protein